MQDIKKIFIRLLFLALLLFLSISLYTFHPLDPGIGVIGEREVKNYGGVLGAYLSSFLFFLFGFSSLFLPLLILVILLLSLRRVQFLFILSFFLALHLGLSLLYDLMGVKGQLIIDRFPLNGGLLGEILISLKSFIGLPGLLFLFFVLFFIPLIPLLKNFFKPKTAEDERGKEAIQGSIEIDTNATKQGPEEESKGDLPKRELTTLEEEEPPHSPAQAPPLKELQLPPPLELLQDAITTSYRLKPEELKERALLLKAKLKEFGIEGEVTGINPGPVITVFEFKPAPGIKLSRILSLVDDLALGLSAKSVRIVAPIPGKNVIGIEISNPQREWVYLKEILTHESFRRSSSPLTLALGKDISGAPVITDLKKMPHLLIAGSTGSGKSIFIHSTILSIIYKSTPEKVRFLMIDPKRIELSGYDGIPYLLYPVVLEPKTATKALNWAVQEMERRYSLFEELSVRNLESYNEQFEEKLPYIVIVIDELADLMVVASKEVETLLTRLAQMARAAGIHLIVATQRPSVDVITGLIKVNFPARISFQVTSKVDSRTILDTQGAERLLGAGDMLFMPPGSSHLLRIHAPYVSEKEVKSVVEYLKASGEPNYLIEFGLEEEEEEEKLISDGLEDELYQEALKIAYQYGKISVSMLQRKLRIGYNRAARLVEKMEEEGILGPSDGVRPRPVIHPRRSL